MNWIRLFDWVTGIIIGLYIFSGILVQILFVVMMQMEVWQQIVTVIPFFISFGYVIWRLYEKGRKRIKQ